MSRPARTPGLTLRITLARVVVIMGLACAVAVAGAATAVAAMVNQTSSAVTETGPPWG